jgi:uncharacterized protein YndB with AHSA1/START domain
MTKAGENQATGATQHDIVITRTFDAPRDLVFKAWTDCDHLMQWWGPRQWPLWKCTLDLRPGGVWHYCMRSSEGQEAWGRAVYREIAGPERLVYTDTFSDADGSIIPPEMLTTVTFTGQQARTLVTIHTVFKSAADRDAVIDMGMEQGMAETLDRLAEHLATLG